MLENNNNIRVRSGPVRSGRWLVLFCVCYHQVAAFFFPFACVLICIVFLFSLSLVLLPARSGSASWAGSRSRSRSCRRKKFEIRAVGCPDSRKYTYYTSSDDKSKHLLYLCRVTHQFSMAMQPKLAELRKLEEEGELHCCPMASDPLTNFDFVFVSQHILNLT